MTAARERVLRADELESLLLIAAVWVDPNATDEEAVFANNEAATLAALEGRPRRVAPRRRRARRRRAPEPVLPLVSIENITPEQAAHEAREGRRAS